MLTFSNLGQLGRLGNQMFQYAALVGISSNRGTEYGLPNRDIALYECFDIPKKFTDTTNSIVSYTEKFEFDNELFNSCHLDSDLYGFFQSERYFSNVKQQIRRDFIFKNHIQKVANFYKNSLFSKNEVIALHIRRSDYLTDKNFCNLTLDYYNSALSKLPEVSVLVLTDDYTWCKNNFTSSKFRISKSGSPYVDLCLMSLCDYHVIANSSFSWWGSWLSNSKHTIAPKKWFTGEFAHWNTKDLYCSTWTVI